MSRENVELVEALLAGVQELDKRALLQALPAILAEVADPQIEWVEDPQRADRRVYRGYAGVRESFERWLEQWEEFGYVLDRCVDCGEDVLVIGSEVGRGAASGAEVNARHYAAVTLRDGRIVRFREFYDGRAARRAVGLEP